MADFKPTLCIDFDGVIHDYQRGWWDGAIYGDMTPGFAAWATAAAQKFTLVVYSSRSKESEGVERMQAFMRRQLAHRMTPDEIDQFLGFFTFAHEKPTAWLTIDDRAICFRGDWSDPALAPDAMLAFRSWRAKPIRISGDAHPEAAEAAT